MHKEFFILTLLGIGLGVSVGVLLSVMVAVLVIACYYAYKKITLCKLSTTPHQRMYTFENKSKCVFLLGIVPRRSVRCDMFQSNPAYESYSPSKQKVVSNNRDLTTDIDDHTYATCTSGSNERIYEEIM